MVLDTPGLYFRAFYGVPRSVRAPDGMVVNAVRGLLDVVARLVTELRPEHLVCCFDADWRPAFRVELVPSYKAHRVAEVLDPAAVPPSVPSHLVTVGEPGQPGANGAGDVGGAQVEDVPDELTPQLPIIDAMLDAFGIARAESAGFEADDVIGTLAARFVSSGGTHRWTA
jgi:5'-3' exonuclease